MTANAHRHTSLCFTWMFTWSFARTHTHTHTPLLWLSCVQSGLRDRAPPFSPSSALIRLFSTGLMGSAAPCLQRFLHTILPFSHTGCFLRASQHCFGFSCAEFFMFFLTFSYNFCWIMRRHCLSVDNGNDVFDLYGCVYPVCRYACHRKCCQKTTTKCSKKVSRPYCAPSQWCPMTVIVLLWVYVQ